MLKPQDGRAAVVIKNTFLSNTDNAAVGSCELMESCNLHSILDCPGGTFIGAFGVKTVVLFFEKGAPGEVWFLLSVGRG